MLSTKQARFALRVMVPVFIAVLSMFLLSSKVPNTKFISSTLDSIDHSKTTVMEFTGATIATSLAISALPDDFASPLANTLAEMNQYFVFILIVIFIERLIVVEGVKVAFMYIIPFACLLYVLFIVSGREAFKSFAYKFLVLGLALVLVVPFSTHFTNVVGADYLAYVDETIDETKAGADKINDIMTTDGGDQTFFEKISNAFHTAVEGVKDLLEYFNNVLKKCVNSVAILVVTTFVMPLVTFLFFRWLLKELFQLTNIKPMVNNVNDKKNKVHARIKEGK